MIKLGNNDITLKVGSNDVSAAYLGSTLVYSRGTPILPSGYTEVEYIENDSTAYIDTGFKPNQDTRINCEMQCVTSTNSVLHFASGGWDKTDGMWLTYETNINGTLHISWLGKTRWSTYSSVQGDYNRHTYDWDKNNIYKDGVLVASNTYANYSCTDNLGIFATIQYGESSVSWLKMLGRVYWFKIYDNGVLVRDYVPVKRDSDNKYGLYDLVNKVFYISPNNVNFIGGNPTHSLPDVPFSLNYNAKQYIASAFTIPQTVGQLQNVDAVCNYGYNIVDHSSDGYISITGNTRMILSGNNGTYLNRFNTESGAAMTIISKAVNKVNSNKNNSLLTNRRRGTIENINWMWRQYYNKMILHGMTDAAQIPCSSSVPNIIAVRTYYDNGTKIYYNNITQNMSTSPESFEYIGNGIDNGGSMFCDYSDNNDEFWEGDFYWIYMSQTTLTDEQIQQVIDYNENL